MAISLNFSGATLFRPGAYSRTQVNLTGGFPVAPAGIVAIVGESDKGTPGSAEDIRLNSYSPAQVADVVAKYGSGPIVDAFKLLVAPSNDARVVNGAQAIYVYKTNLSTKATGTLPTAYGTVSSKNYGFDQNTVSFQTLSAQAEVLPTIAPFAFITDETSASALKVRVNGGAVYNVAIPATTTPAAFVSAFNLAVTGMLAGGGANRGTVSAGMVAGGEKLEVAYTDNLIATFKVTLGSAVWAVAPTIGDSLYIPTGSVLAGAGNANCGGYLVLSATTDTIVAVKLADPTVAGSNVGAIDIAAVTDLICYSPVTLTCTASTPAGVAAAYELADGGAAVAFEELMGSGSDRALINATRVVDGSKLKLTVISGAQVSIQIDSAFAATAQVGDLLIIRPGSIIDGAGSVNVGTYLVTAATVNTITATKYSGTPAGVVYTDIAATTDLLVYSGITSHVSAPVLLTSSAEPEITISLDRQADSVSEDSVALGGNIALKIGYVGTTAVMTINSSNLVTTIAGGSGSSLTIKLADYDTIQALVNYIDAQTDYTCEVGNNVYAQLAPTILDRVSAVGICGAVAGSMPGRIKKDSDEVQSFFDASELCDITRTVFVGLPTVMTSPIFLTGGTKGGTSAASVAAGLDELKKVRVNSVVPLFSRDATDDILDELTEPSSTYQISAINAAVKSHCLLMSNTQNRSERNAFCSIKTTYALTKTQAQGLASERISLCLQDVKILKTDGTLDWVQPWGMAAACAGMQAGAVIGEPMTYKFINISGIQHASFDPALQADDAIEAGLLFAEQPSFGGFRIVVGNTTYGKDANFVYNRISVMYAADTCAFNLRQQLENIFVGVSAATASAESIKNTCIAILGTFRAAGLIVGDDTNAGTGYKNLVVRLVGNVCYIDCTLTIVQGIDFLLPTITLDSLRQTA